MTEDLPVTDHNAARRPASDASVDGDAGDSKVHAEWDGRYADRGQLWSGQPNGALVAEVAGLEAGRVLDVGCGEGADAPGGVLLVVHHAGMETHLGHDSGFDPADDIGLSMVAALLDDSWELERHEQRPRVAPDGGAGAHHTDDEVLRARRLR